MRYSLFTFLFFITQNFFGQAVLQIHSLDHAITIALKSNKLLQANNLDIESEKTLKKASFNPDKTFIGVEYGQINSSTNDFSFAINQNIKFPTYYSKKAHLSNEQIKSAQLEWKLLANQVQEDVKNSWYQLEYLYATRDLLRQKDTIYNDFRSLTKITEESSIAQLLENATAGAKSLEIDIELNEVNSSIDLELQTLSLLLNQEIDTIPYSNELTQLRYFNIDSTTIENNPIHLYNQHQAILFDKKIKLQKAEYLPELNFGYYNMSMIGEVTENGSKYYQDGKTRFVTVSGGVSIPLWTKHNHAEIRSIKLQLDASQIRAQHYKKEVLYELERSTKRYQTLYKNLVFYSEEVIPRADLLLENAQKGYKNGKIHYIEYTNAIEQAINIKTDYLERLNKFNHIINHIEFLIGKGHI